MSRYTISDEAIEDLDRISDYFLQNNLETGEQFIQAFKVNVSHSRNMMVPISISIGSEILVGTLLILDGMFST
jgi:hypothetical protein